jgi:hypothetical protein
MGQQGGTYRVKFIKFFSRDAPIFMQNVNGPCPLLALANILSLRNQLAPIPRDAPDISQQRLIALVADVLLEQNRPADQPEHFAANLQQNLSDVLEVFEKLAVGLDVNLRFHRRGPARAARRRPLPRAAAPDAGRPPPARAESTASSRPGRCCCSTCWASASCTAGWWTRRTRPPPARSGTGRTTSWWSCW